MNLEALEGQIGAAVDTLKECEELRKWHEVFQSSGFDANCLGAITVKCQHCGAPQDLKLVGLSAYANCGENDDLACLHFLCSCCEKSTNLVVSWHKGDTNVNLCKAL